MRLKRYKKIQRHMSFFTKNFRFRTPFQILVDGTFAQAALVTKVNIQDQLPKYLNSQVKLLTTPCIVTETEGIGPQVFGALNILKQFPTHKCSHTRLPEPADKCIISMVSPVNPNRYIVATQDPTLRDRLREIPGVALLYLHGNAPTLERPSEISTSYAAEQSLKRMEVLDYQKEILNALKKSVMGDELEEKSTLKKGTTKRKRAGPNPLSCKKSKKKIVASQNKSHTQTEKLEKLKKRRRVKIRVPKHVKAEREYRG